MAQKIKVQQWDNGIKLIFNIKKDGFIEPLTGATVKLKLMGKETGRTLNRVCSITDSEMAEVMYILTTKDLDVADGYTSEIQVEYSNGTILSLDNPIILIVTPEVISNVDTSRRI